MLRVFKQYYPIRNIFFVVGEGIFIFISVFVVSRILLGNPPPADDGWLLLKILLITTVCQACLYYNDLYDFKVSSNFNELGIRLMEALGFAAIFLAVCIYPFSECYYRPMDFQRQYCRHYFADCLLALLLQTDFRSGHVQ